MNKIFTKDFLARFKQVGRPFERDYIRRLSTDPRFQSHRETLERQVSIYPEQDRPQLIKSFQNSKGDQCYAIMNELDAYERLAKLHSVEYVEVEPKFKIISGRPDFFVNKNIVIEVFTVMDNDNPFEKSIHEIIQNLDSKKLVFSLNKIYGINRKQNPKTRDIKQYFKSLIEAKKSIISSENFDYTSNSGIYISGTVSPNNGLHNNGNLSSISKNYYPNIDEYEKQLRIKIRSRVKEKLKKYNRLKDLNLPIIIIIYDDIKIIFKSKNDWQEILNGKKGRHDDLLIKDRVFRENKNRSLSLIIVAKQQERNHFYYFKNQYALFPVSEYQEAKLKKEFKPSF